MKIVIIDDNKTQASMLKDAILEHLMFTTNCEPDIELIVDSADIAQFDDLGYYKSVALIIIDQHLGEFEGLSLARKWLGEHFGGQILLWTGDLSVSDEAVVCLKKGDEKLFEVLDSLIVSESGIFDE